jgi:mRNA-degrading endonuclease RelE of RelBE toxin-antitoxin system
MYSIEWGRKAFKELRSLPARDIAALRERVENFARDPFANHGDWVERLSGEPFTRIRAGEWRAIVRVVPTTKTVTVLRVGHRSMIYRKRR